MKKHFLFGFALFFLVQTPFIFAIDCNDLDAVYYPSCIEIMNSELTDEEKDLLISNLEYSNKFFPDHEYISQINKNIQLTTPPEGIKTHYSKFIKNAWADILVAMPSVLYNGELYAPSKTQILSGFNHEVVLPSNYYSPRYPKTRNEDCKTKYYLRKNTAENKVYVNNIYQGSGRLVDVNINSNAEIKIKYIIRATIKIKHYEWEDEECEYDYTEYKTDYLKIEDSIKVKFYTNNLFAEAEQIDSYGSAEKFKINYSNSIYLKFKDSFFKEDEFIYNINYSKAPYYFYTLHAKDYNQITLNNVLLDRDFILVKDSDDCRIKGFDFFNIIESPCKINQTNENFYIKTDKLKYKPDETINVNIYPKNISVLVTYGNETKQAINSITFKAEPLHNKIIAEYKTQKSEKIIFISDNKIKVLWNLFVLVFLNCFLYFILKKYWGGFI